MSLKQSQAGVTLTELMVGITISVFLSLVAATAYVGTTRLSGESTEMAARESQFAMVSEMITSNLRRAGYRGDAAQATAHWLTTAAGVDGSTPAVTVSGDGSCVVTSAAVKSDGSYTVNQFGVKLDGNVVKALSAPTVDCSTGDWVALTDINSQYFHTLRVEVFDETILNGDTGSEIEVSADEALTSWQKANCGTEFNTSSSDSASGSGGSGSSDSGDSGSNSSSESANAAVSCRIKQLYKVTLCANDESTEGSCDSAEAYYAQWLVAPRNDVVISKPYAVSESSSADDASSAGDSPEASSGSS